MHLFVTVVAFVLVCSVSVRGQAPARMLTPDTTLELRLHLATVENAQLRAALSRLQTELDTIKLTAERAALEAKAREQLMPPEGSTFDWQTLTFKTPPKGPTP